MSQLGRRGNRSALSRTNRGRFDPRRTRAASQRIARTTPPRINRTGAPRIGSSADLRRNQPSSRPSNARRPNPGVNGRSLPRPDLGKFDRNRNTASHGLNRFAKANHQPAPSNQGGRRFENMNGASMPPKDNTPKGQDNTQKQPEPKGPKGRDTRQPNAGDQIKIDWINNFVNGVRTGVVNIFSPSNLVSPGTLWSACKPWINCPSIGTRIFNGPGDMPSIINLPDHTLGKKTILRAVETGTAPLPTLDGALLETLPGMVKPIDPNDPLSTPVDKTVKGWRLFDTFQHPPAWNDLNK